VLAAAPKLGAVWLTLPSTPECPEGVGIRSQGGVGHDEVRIDE